VLYEMLTGRQTFQGETVTETIAAILMREPDLSAIPANLHPKLGDVLRRCLAKNLKERWHAIADVRVELETIMADPKGLKIARGVDMRPLWKRAVPVAIATLLSTAIGVAITAFIMCPPATL